MLLVMEETRNYCKMKGKNIPGIHVHLTLYTKLVIAKVGYNERNGLNVFEEGLCVAEFCEFGDGFRV